MIFKPRMPDKTFRDSSKSFEAGESRSAAARAALPVDGLDPLLIAASVEVDRTLLRWMLTLSPRARLRASTKATQTLARFRRGSS